jgi:ATP-dependent RNA helicase RhlE
VFTRTKHGANTLAEKLNKADISAAAIHGNKSQAARTRALAQFKDSTLQVLVATDIAARGIDIDQLPQVVNFELPNVPEDYVHRIGRTGRAGNEGEAISLVCVDELDFLRSIERLIKREIPREVVTGFEPDPNAKPQPIELRSNEPRPPRQGRGGQPQRKPQQGQPRAPRDARPNEPRQPLMSKPSLLPPYPDDVDETVLPDDDWQPPADAWSKTITQPRPGNGKPRPGQGGKPRKAGGNFAGKPGGKPGQGKPKARPGGEVDGNRAQPHRNGGRGH